MPLTKLSAKDKQMILKVARHAIQYGLLYHQAPKIELTQYPAELQDIGASFVTLKESNQLRGCIGTLEAYQPLIQDVAEHAFAAAFKDPRFPPVKHIEEPMIHISISILSPAEPLYFDNEADLLAKLKPGVDGIIFNYQQHKATFLPAVWQQLSDPAEFMSHLKQKAGLSADFWSDEIQLMRYTTTSID